MMAFGEGQAEKSVFVGQRAGSAGYVEDGSVDDGLSVGFCDIAAECVFLAGIMIT